VLTQLDASAARLEMRLQAHAADKPAALRFLKKLFAGTEVLEEQQ